MEREYICGPTLLRLPGRAAIIPGERFRESFTPAEEARKVASGAIRLVEVPAPAAAPVTGRPARRSTAPKEK